MMCYSTEPRDWIFAKGYGFLSKNISKIISKDLSGKYRQKRFDNDIQSATNASIKAIKKSRGIWWFDW